MEETGSGRLARRAAARRSGVYRRRRLYLARRAEVARAPRCALAIVRSFLLGVTLVASVVAYLLSDGSWFIAERVTRSGA